MELLAGWILITWLVAVLPSYHGVSRTSHTLWNLNNTNGVQSSVPGLCAGAEIAHLVSHFMSPSARTPLTFQDPACRQQIVGLLSLPNHANSLIISLSFFFLVSGIKFMTSRLPGRHVCHWAVSPEMSPSIQIYTYCFYFSREAWLRHQVFQTIKELY